MPANTYTLIEKIVIGATSAERITFTSIPQGYTDLKIVASVRSESPNPYDFIYGYVNGVSGIHYPGRRLRGDGSSASSATSNVSYFDLQYVNGNGATANTFGNLEIYFPNYSGSNQKSFSIDSVTETNSTTAYAHMWSYNYTNGTSAITSIVLASGSGYFKQYSSFYLYGIAKEGVSPGTSSAPYATGGDRIVFDGTYWYHAFTSSGTFTPRKNINCDVLVVAGGGSGGWPYSGGGGAGGVIAFASQSLSTAQTVTVGGGAAGAYNTGNGQQGSNSQFGSLTAAVGGGGGVGDSTVTTARNGGSGGGGHPYGRGNPSTDNAGGTATSGQGNAGGLGSPNGSTQDSGGGGGGAGAVGANATTTAAGAGGAGTNSVTNWGALSAVLTATGLGVSGYIAGGGGGGTNGSNAGAGGSGGGGRGANNAGTQESEAGTANTGSGSGGGAAGNAPASPKNAGSGLVLVRYLA